LHAFVDLEGEQHACVGRHETERARQKVPAERPARGTPHAAQLAWKARRRLAKYRLRGAHLPSLR
jgi:hypothetical protein